MVESGAIQNFAASQVMSVDFEVLKCAHDQLVIEPKLSCSEEVLSELEPKMLTVMVAVVDEGTCSIQVDSGCNKGRVV